MTTTITSRTLNRIRASVGGQYRERADGSRVWVETWRTADGRIVETTVDVSQAGRS